MPSVVYCSKEDFLRTQITCAQGKTKYPCQLCNRHYPWFRLFVFENSATHGYRGMGPQSSDAYAEALELSQSTIARTQLCKRKVCINCEISWRVDSQEWHNRAVGRTDPDWSSEKAVIAEMKRQNKGHFRQTKAAQFNAA